VTPVETVVDEAQPVVVRVARDDQFALELASQLSQGRRQRSLNWVSDGSTHLKHTFPVRTEDASGDYLYTIRLLRITEKSQLAEKRLVQ
jgi:hypothetical protein